MEKAGVAVSVVYSELSSAAAVQMRPRYGDQFTEDLAGKPFFVTGISLVMHGKNPHVPTVHMNYRYFEVFDDQGQPLVWWFGGGADLTPCYLYEDDAIHFHQLHKDGCDAIDGSGALYDQCKLACDTYFYNSHRQEARGIGGVFYDNLHHLAPDCLFDLTQALGDRFLPAYLPILTRRKDTYFTADEVHWQQIRRGRYVEFNLLHDRGTKFGLQTPCAQIEAIFMTMPLLARWEYNYYPHHASPEAAMEHVLKKPRDWLGLEQEKSVSK
ncbi:Coproporphyrinogen III oxidase [Hesseltinella vesiculosa]|uniref:coproporphyrinogen oxidase n=1 Tax=Hesseltinella vesiculosa TaxID=101127 RepID=A0A1X2GBM9_9FUNG|nr:Coproporphyrinogen III oxidase [Hesseltinella vesiculosa]